MRLWKAGLQKLATGPGIGTSVCHLPPAASRWNRIEHRLFPFISMNWRGKPLRDPATIISLIRATTTESGLKVYCDIDENHYPKGIAVEKRVMDALSIRRDPFHGEWNYTFLPATEDEALI